jgi:hypothetical protein
VRIKRKQFSTAPLTIIVQYELTESTTVLFFTEDVRGSPALRALLQWLDTSVLLRPVILLLEMNPEAMFDKGIPFRFTTARSA